MHFASETWNLETIFSGGSDSPALDQFLITLEKQIAELAKSTSISIGIQLWQKISAELGEAGTFVSCLAAQNVKDEQADLVEARLNTLQARFEIASLHFDELLCQFSEQDFTKLLEVHDAIAFPLAERRQRKLEKLDSGREALISDLAPNGYHGWSQLYYTCLGRVVIPLVIENKPVDVSWGQAYNLLASPDRSLRKQIFEKASKIWKEQEAIYASILNRIAGFRLKVYEHRKWSFLKEPLFINRMDSKTLETMWRVVAKNRAPFIEYLKLKAERSGLKKLSWYDLMAPLPQQENERKTLSYSEAADFIIDHFTTFSPKMGAFAKRAFAEKWIEAENRGGKRPGGFCAGVPLKKESRIFMTFSGTQESLFTLAHELGHAYHNHVIYDQPEMARQFPMNLAETASTFAEMVFSEASYQQERDPARKRILLESKLQRSAIFLLNIHARFIFETHFYEERQKGVVSSERLCELMVAAQRETYGDGLDEPEPYFWLNKMHFNSTGVPFYNFPYTFGYLFSLGVYLHAQKVKAFGEDGYTALLADTGKMTAEDLAKKHLGVDLREDLFWQNTLDFLKKDVEAYKL